ncbi:MAG: DUF4215 domain-containing protein [Polyangiales bacterium]
MKARLYTALAVVLVASGCAQSSEEVPTPADSSSDDVQAETSADTATDSSMDSADASDASGDVSMDASLCGNGFVNTGEECDDGNLTAGDGCSPTCTLEPTSTADVCDGDTLTLTSTSDTTWKGTLSGDTSTANPNYTSKCGGGLSKDLVYQFVAPTDGKAVITLEPEFAAVISVRGTCKDAGSELGCIDQSTPKVEPISVTVPITKGQSYFAIVDGYGGASGKFKLTVETLGEKCGNGRLEGGEQCEDGNVVDGDGCNSSCRIEDADLLLKCPGPTFKFKTGGAKTLLLGGNYLYSPLNFEGSCFVTTSNQNMVYSFISEYAATMHLDLHNDRGGVELYMRSECAGGPLTIGTPPDLGCAFGGGKGTPLSLDVPILPGRTYTLFVDSSIIFDKPDAGPFTLDVKMVDPKCGNGILESGEEWDDGNTVSGDGVTADCKLEPSMSSDKCTATPSTMPAITVNAVGDGTYTAVQSGTTTAATGGDFKTCPVGVSGPQAPDVVYRLPAPIDGLATVTVTGKFQPLISAFSTCVDSAASMIGCDNLGVQKISFPVTKDTDTFLVVDSFSSSKNGAYTLNVTITPPVCGNGVKEGTETCDDSNTTNGDGCSSTCALEPVTAHEKCADAELVDMGTADATGAYKATIASGITNLKADQTIAPCTSAGKDAVYKVVAPVSGVITARVTAPFDASLGIREGTCTDTGAPKRCSETGPKAIEQVRIPVVKDGVYYVVVDSVTATDSGWFNLDVSVTPSKCGDGFIGGTEQCDDGNTANGDGCSSTCTMETLTGVDTCPGYTVPFVSDGMAQIALVTVDTSKLSADYAASCGGAAKDAVLSYTPPIAGKAVVEVLENDRVILFTRTICGDASTQTGCATKKLTFPVAAGKPFSVFVDGPPGVEGPATVRVTVTP